jgi:hypothetical protein
MNINEPAALDDLQGGHYAAHQVPELLVGDLWKFFRRLYQR